MSEINYHPRDPESQAELDVTDNDGDFEFLELLNVAGETLEMGGVHFSSGVGFVFPAGTLAAGERLLVVKDQEAFQVRYPSVPASQIAGEFIGGTGLNNGGEQVVLTGITGEMIQDFRYDDRSPWPEEPDGDGAALVLVDPTARPDHSLALSWRASRLIDGSPGGDEDEFDIDLDGLPDDWERFWFGGLAELAGGDSDMDELLHSREFDLGTDPTSADSDFDGIGDAAELAAGTDPLRRDTDGDSLSDGIEILVHLSDPLLADTDGDGLDDSGEVVEYGTDPLSRDSDGDGSGDFYEVWRGSDPNSSNSVALAREGDFLVYASLDSPESLGGGMLEMDWAPVEGAVAGGLCFTADDALDYGAIGDPGVGSLSAVLWFEFDAPGARRTLVSKGDGWAIVAEAGDLIWRVGGVGEITLPGGAVGGGWHQVALVIDRGVGIVRGFYDGSEVGAFLLEDDTSISSAQGLGLGTGGGARVCLDDFALLDFGMNALEIRALYDGGLRGFRAADVIGGGDMDLDGLRDDWEIAQFGDLAQSGDGDSDGDGLTNDDEEALGTDPLLADSDGDGIDDRQEILAGSDPLDAGGPSDLLDGLLLYSSFDATTVTGSGSGARVFDLSVPAENGLVSGAIGIVPGRVGGAARQTDGVVNYGDVHDPGTGSYSVSVWFQADELGGGIVQRVVGKGRIDDAGASTGWQIMVFGEDVAVVGGTEDGGEWFVRGMPAGQARLRIGEWNHAVLVIDRTAAAGQVRLFVNGAEIAAGRPSDALLADGLAIGDGAALITHGQSGAGERFSGAIDELAIWERAVSTAEVAALFRGGLVLASLDDLTGSAGLEAEFQATPESITMVVNPGETAVFNQVLNNAGDGRAQWFADLRFVKELTLETALDRIDSGAAGLLEPIPFRYAFTEGALRIEYR